MRNKAVIVISCFLAIIVILYFDLRKKYLDALTRANEIAKTARGVNRELEKNLDKVLFLPDFAFRFILTIWLKKIGIKELRDTPLILNQELFSYAINDKILTFYVRAVNLNSAGIN